MWNIPLVLATVLFASAWFSNPAAAAPESFNQNLVIYDDEFVDYLSLSKENIQAFLNTKSGVLKSHTFNGKSAAEWIFEAAQANRISPKVLIVTLQKEQSLITNPSPSQRAIDYAMGYGCPDSGSCSESTKGFDKQVDYAAWQFRRYLDQIAVQGYTVSYWGPGIEKTITCISSDQSRGLCTAGTQIKLNPVNRATAALYTYTPHPGGNYSFWTIWQGYNFNLQRTYPTGSLLRAQGSPDVWLVQNDLKRRFTNSAAFQSRYSFAQVITVPADHLLFYNNGTEISYANYSLLASPQGGVYLLVDDSLRPIRSRTAFQNAGFRNSEVVRVSWAELNKFTIGSDITTENVYPSGRLLQDNQTGGIFFVQESQRHPIVCREIYKSQFGLRRPTPVSPSELDQYTYSSPIGFKDGDLVTAGATAYVISGGAKRPIADPETFNAYRFGWGNLQRVAQSCVDVHPNGLLLDIAQSLDTASQ